MSQTTRSHCACNQTETTTTLTPFKHHLETYQPSSSKSNLRPAQQANIHINSESSSVNWKLEMLKQTVHTHSVWPNTNTAAIPKLFFNWLWETPAFVIESHSNGLKQSQGQTNTFRSKCWCLPLCLQQPSPSKLIVPYNLKVLRNEHCSFLMSNLGRGSFSKLCRG